MSSKPNCGYCWIMFLIVVPALFWALSSIDMAMADYAGSAHGNRDPGYGVNRTGTECPLGTACPTGDCTHCHDTFDPEICGQEDGPPYMLFAANDADLCLSCHDNTTDPSNRAIANRSYSYRAGGYTDDMLDDIAEAFGSTSKHNLADIQTLINGKWGYTVNSNPCTACHNQHLAQGDPANDPDSAKASDTRGWPISLPSDHDNDPNPWGLWGDVSSERMDAYTSNYQAPYRYGSTSAYEPDGSTTMNGSNLTDFNTFCTQCHNTTYTIYSTSLGRDLRQIDWDAEKHGKGNADGALDEMRNPYGAVMGKVLSCMDCHEAHGASNVYLVRDVVNGEELDDAITAFTPFCNPPGDSNIELGWLCRRCHKDDSNYSGGVVNQWKFVHHYTNYTPDAPYVRTRCYLVCHKDSSAIVRVSCGCCHYHGSQTTDLEDDYPCYVDPYVCAGREPYDRRTF